jgi:pilus assembly protein CpaC
MRRSFRAIAVLTALVCLVPARALPQTAAELPSGAAAAAAVTAPGFPTLLVVAGGSTVVQTDFPITRVAVANPEIADATVVDPRQVLVDGKTSGTVSLIVWGRSDMKQYAVNVFPATPTLQRQFQLLFPGEDIHVNVADEALVLSGKVSSRDIATRAIDIAGKSSTKVKVVNMLQVPGETQGAQVMLQVRVAEVSQRALLELGASFFTGPAGYKQWVGRVTTQQFPAPDFSGRLGPPPPTDPQSEGKLSFSDFLNLFVLNTKYDVGVVIDALRQRGYFQSLAEPTLIAYNGQEASFLAGGEIPVPIVQGGNNGAISVSYKEFGVRLTFRPDITGDVIRMKVRPEVSSLDFANGVTLAGFRIPALTTRRAETDVELRDGQSFAIGGLLNNMSQTDRSAIPLLGDLPIIGNLFKSKAERKERTELVVIITPHLVQPLTAGAPLPLPNMPQQFLPPAGTKGAVQP